jgi:protein-arginine kinase activator protein McsA
MIERAHEGGCTHIGKVPKRALCEYKDQADAQRLQTLLGDARQREERLEQLRALLAKSVQSEDYEQAALYRDELTRLSTLADSQIEPRPTSGRSTINEQSSASS